MPSPTDAQLAQYAASLDREAPPIDLAELRSGERPAPFRAPQRRRWIVPAAAAAAVLIGAAAIGGVVGRSDPQPDVISPAAPPELSASSTPAVSAAAPPNTETTSLARTTTAPAATAGPIGPLSRDAATVELGRYNIVTRVGYAPEETADVQAAAALVRNDCHAAAGVTLEPLAPATFEYIAALNKRSLQKLTFDDPGIAAELGYDATVGNPPPLLSREEAEALGAPWATHADVVRDCWQVLYTTFNATIHTFESHLPDNAQAAQSALVSGRDRALADVTAAVDACMATAGYPDMEAAYNSAWIETGVDEAERVFAVAYATCRRDTGYSQQLLRYYEHGVNAYLAENAGAIATSLEQRRIELEKAREILTAHGLTPNT